jgi:hypothetical protein
LIIAPKIRSFAAGELAPALHARTDLVKYAMGAKTLRNMQVLRNGGAQNRPGTRFVAEVKTSSLTCRLIPFVFNDSQTYVLEFGNLYMRVHQDGAQLTDLSWSITNITNANPVVVTYTDTGTDPTNGYEVAISGIVGPMGSYLNGRNFKVANVNSVAATFELREMDGSTVVDSTSYGAYTSGGTASQVYEITTTYATADLDDLRFSQKADVMVIVHPSYPVRELSRAGHTSWSLTTVTFTPGVDEPGSLSTSGGAAKAGSEPDNYYAVTSFDEETGEESLSTNVSQRTTVPSATNPISFTWGAVSGISYFNIYKAIGPGGAFGFVGRGDSNRQFDDIGLSPDYDLGFPLAYDPTLGSNNKPSAVTYFQQRLFLAGSNNNPSKIFGSRIGLYHNFTNAFPLNDDCALSFTLDGKKVNRIKHLLDVGKLFLMTSGGWHVCEGNEAGVLVPSSINPRQRGYYGVGDLAPLPVGSDAILYIQSRGGIVRDINPETYQDVERTILSSHLFDGYTIIDWAYQEIPHSIVWAVRVDGVLLGLTYLKDQDIYAWHRHDTDGTIENVCCVPGDSTGDAVYLVVKRTINGATKRYIERMNSRIILTDTTLRGTDNRLVGSVEDDLSLMDSALSYNGWNATGASMTLSGGTDWVYTETLTLTCSTSQFASTDVGNKIILKYGDEVVRFTIDAYSSATVVTGRVDRTVPSSMRNVAIVASATLESGWADAVDEISGLWHLEGKDVSVFADGLVVGSPNNPSVATTYTVTNGAIALDDCYAVVHVGLPFVSDLETLDLDTDKGQRDPSKKKMVSQVMMHVQDTRGVFVAGSFPDDDAVTNMRELQPRASGEAYEVPELLQGRQTINIKPEWNSNGRICVRQVDPTPVTILSVTPILGGE